MPVTSVPTIVATAATLTKFAPAVQKFENSVQELVEKHLPFMQIVHGLHKLAGQGYALNGLSALKQIVDSTKLLITAKSNGRTADYNTAKENLASAAKQLLVDGHPLVWTIKAVKKIIAGIKSILPKSRSSKTKDVTPSDTVNGSNSYRGGNKHMKQNKKGNSIPKTNHPGWYEAYLKRGGKGLIALNFGRRKSLNSSVLSDLGISIPNARVGGNTSAIGKLNIDLAIPHDSLSSFQQAIAIMYSKIRAANAGAINYSPAQLATYVLNVRSVRAMLAQFRRTLALTNYVDPYDADLPKTLVELSSGYCFDIRNATARGYRYEAWLANKANAYNYLTTWLKTVKALLPLNINLLDRTDWIYSNVFKDSNDVKSNYWIMSSYRFPKYVHTVVGNTETITSTYVNILPAQSSVFTLDASFTDIFGVIDDFITDVTADPVNTIIAGDILKALGNSAFYGENALEIGEAVTPIYDEAALTQIQNATIIGTRQDIDPAAINVPTNTLVWQTSVYTLHIPTVSDLTSASELGLTTQYVNANKDVISAGEAIAYTRFKCVSSTKTKVDSGNTYYYNDVVLNGSEVVTSLDFAIEVHPNYGYPATVTISTSNLDKTDTNATDYTEYVNAWTVLDWAPFVVVTFTGNSATNRPYAFLFDFNNYAIMSVDEQSTMHQYATLALLEISHNISRESKFSFAD